MKKICYSKRLVPRLVTLLMLFIATGASAQATSYNIKIGGVELTSDNCGNISLEGGFPAVTQGYLKYDPGSNMLIVHEGTVIESPSAHAIDFYGTMVRKYTLLLEGESKISAFGRANSALVTSTKLIIAGGSNGTCTFSSEGRAAIEARENVVLNVEYCNINAQGGQYGILGTERTGGMEIIQSNVKARGRLRSMGGFEYIALSGCQLTAPLGATIEAGEVRVDGSATTEEVVIRRPVELGLRIGGIDVTDLNYHNITPEGGFESIREGRVSYDPNTRTLTLEEAVIKYDGGSTAIIFNGTTNETPEWTIRLRGTNIVSSVFAGLFSDVNLLTIEGDAEASLEISSSEREAIGVWGNLRFNECSVRAKGLWGITGSPLTESSVFTIVNANVSATGQDGSVCSFHELFLRGVEILQPADAVWSPRQQAICHSGDGSIVTEEVVIGRSDPNAVESTPANAGVRPQSAFSLSGQSLPANSAAPRGVYIVDGKKVVK